MTHDLKALKVLVAVIRQGHHSHVRRNGHLVTVRRLLEELRTQSQDDRIADGLHAMQMILHDTADGETHRDVKQRLWLFDELVTWLISTHGEAVLTSVWDAAWNNISLDTSGRADPDDLPV